MVSENGTRQTGGNKTDPREKARAFFKFYSKELRPNGVALYNALRLHADKNNQCWPSHETLADFSGMCRQTVIKTLESMEEKGFIRIERRTEGGKQTSIYTLLKVIGDVKDINIGSDVKDVKSDVKDRTFHAQSDVNGFNNDRGTDVKNPRLGEGTDVKDIDMKLRGLVNRSIGCVSTDSVRTTLFEITGYDKALFLSESHFRDAKEAAVKLVSVNATPETLTLFAEYHRVVLHSDKPDYSPPKIDQILSEYISALPWIGTQLKAREEAAEREREIAAGQERQRSAAIADQERSAQAAIDTEVYLARKEEERRAKEAADREKELRGFIAAMDLTGVPPDDPLRRDYDQLDKGAFSRRIYPFYTQYDAALKQQATQTAAH
jgi:hypothetical protein